MTASSDIAIVEAWIVRLGGMLQSSPDYLPSLRGWVISLALTLICGSSPALAQNGPSRALSGVVITARNEAVPGAIVIVRSASGEQRTESDAEGRFRLTVPNEPVTLRVEGKYIVPRERIIGTADSTNNLEVTVEYRIPPVHESIVITATQLDPSIDRRDDAIYRDTLFSRDDQVFYTLNAGINLGQQEGGGKSLEVRRFGFNLDHGGVNGGLKVLVDDVQQNQGTQGHGQGYLGQLKSLTPELVKDVDIINGPFRAEYGDFSGLGVVHIRLKESLPDQVTGRIQGGSFGTVRGFLAYSPELKNADSFIAYETSHTDGPYRNPLRYQRDNLTGNFTWHSSRNQALGLKLNFGRNNYFSSGQIPLDQVAAGRLDRYGFIDPDDGGRVRSGTLGIYYRKEWDTGDVLKLDGFLSRSLFDLYSNFTFFLNDQVNGDGIRQHDSRLQEGANVQFIHPYTLFGRQALLTLGGNFHENQINVGLDQRVKRVPIETITKANVHVTNSASYAQQGIDLLQGKLRLDAGLRFDYFRFSVGDQVNPLVPGVQGATRFQPKANIVYTPSERIPMTLYLNYGRGISSQDARGVVQRPESPRISTTDFYQIGTSHNINRFSVSTDLFLIDRSNEQVYIPDDGSLEFKGPSRSYGYELKSSAKVLRFLTFNAGVTRIGNAFYRGTTPRIYVDSAPHVVANAAFTLTGWRGFTGSLRYRHIGNYRLDGTDPGIRASGLDVVDFSMSKHLQPWVELNFSVDNLTDKRYFETQNYFESRLHPADPVVARIHGTPGYPVGVAVGLTFHLFGK